MSRLRIKHFPLCPNYTQSLLVNSQDLIVNFPLRLLHNSWQTSQANLVQDQDNNFCLISLGILICPLLDTVWILLGEVSC